MASTKINTGNVYEVMRKNRNRSQKRLFEIFQQIDANQTNGEESSGLSSELETEKIYNEENFSDLHQTLTTNYDEKVSDAGEHEEFFVTKEQETNLKSILFVKPEKH